MLAEYRQTGVSFDRLRRLMPSAPPDGLVRHQQAHLTGPLPEVPYSPKTAAHRLDLVEVDGLSYRYGGDGRGIEGIRLRVPRGSFTVVTGRIGSGKTTLLRVLLGLLPRDAGVVRWNGEPVDDLAAFFVPPRSAYTSQVPRLFSEPLRDNILMGLPDGTAPISTAPIHAAVMERDVEELEDGLDTVVGARGVKLSGGQLRRSAAARMFVREPELLVFDDLSSGLDVDTEGELWARLFARDRRHCAGGVPPSRRAPTRRSRRRPEGRPRRGGGHAGRAVGRLRGDAPPLGRRRRRARGFRVVTAGTAVIPKLRGGYPHAYHSSHLSSTCPFF